MVRLLNLWLQFAKNSIVREMEFKGNFLTQMAVEIGWTMVSIFAFEMIFIQTETIAGWRKAEVYLIYAIFRLASALSSIVSRKNIMRFSFLINSGEFDFYLTKPVDTLFFSTTRIVSFDRVSQFSVGVVLVVYSLWIGDITISSRLITGLLILVPTAAFIRFCIEMLIVIPIFWMQKLENITDLIFTLMGPARFPRAAFPATMRHILTFVIPIMFVAAIPAEIILGKLPEFTIALFVLFALILFFIMRKFFYTALRYYSSASS